MSAPAHVAAALLAAGVLAVGALTGCADSDVEEGCTAGPCDDGVTSSTDAATTGGGDGGGGAGGAGGGPGCGFDETNGLPCDVFTVLDAHCHRCHTDPTVNGAPFPLLTWDHFQADYFGKPVWQRAQTAIQPDAIPRMPFGEDPLPEETRAVLEAWFATCEAGVCAGADEGGGAAGAGGAGGAGGAPGSGGAAGG